MLAGMVTLFTLLRTCQTVTPVVAPFCFHQQWMWFPVSIHSCQHLLLSVCFIRALLEGVKWYPILILVVFPG